MRADDDDEDATSDTDCSAEEEEEDEEEEEAAAEDGAELRLSRVEDEETAAKEVESDMTATRRSCAFSCSYHHFVERDDDADLQGAELQHSYGPERRHPA